MNALFAQKVWSVGPSEILEWRKGTGLEHVPDRVAQVERELEHGPWSAEVLEAPSFPVQHILLVSLFSCRNQNFCLSDVLLEETKNAQNR